VTPEQAYEKMVELSREESVLASCLDLLEWDEEVSMPPSGVAHRAEQRALLAGLVHDRATDPRYDELLDAVEGSPLVADSDGPVAANVREIRRAFDKERKLPRRLVEEWARVTAVAQATWAESRRNDDYASFAPWLDRIFALARERADAVGYDDAQYDALVDDYEPGMTTAHLLELLPKLQAQLVPLVAELRAVPAPPPDVLARDFPIDRQKTFAERTAETIGYDLRAGRLDVSQHPFCAPVGPGDVRIALRYDARDFGSGFFALMHEAGHALYDQGLDPRHYGTPMGEAASLGLHESQSRLWENLVGRSEGFWRHFYPRLRATFDSMRDLPLETFRRAVNYVAPSPIRVEADEVTYNLHVGIRFELELALLSGDLHVKELPGAWNELYERRLGIVPASDREGCLQDIHWSEGLIGYFPTYTLGNIYAAQLFAAAERAVGPLEASFARGEFAPLLGWLREHVHRHGKRWPVATLIERATGEGPNPAHLVDSLTRRYVR
jgi:carboxypeptidase Taq